VRARGLLAEARAAGQTNLDLSLAREVLACAGLRYNGSATVKNADEAVAAAEKIGFPVVVKVVSPDVLHKSDVGGVVLDCIHGTAVREACAGIAERVEHHQPGASITGFTIEEQVSGTEIIVGMSRDPGFGPLMMVGMGGIFVEVYKDVAFRLIPLERRDALDMIGEIQAQPLLDGARGRPVLDRGELAEVLARVSNLVDALPEIRELDLNPFVITPDGLVAIDGRVII
jgi:acetyltransferase